MLIVDGKYKFRQLEIDRLKKVFKNIKMVKYANRDENEVLSELEHITKQDDFTLLVLNTRAKVGDKIIKFLTNLQFLHTNKSLRIISIEHFLEEFLQKCYIPDDHTDLSFLENIRPFTKF